MIQSLIDIFGRELASKIFEASYSATLTSLLWTLQLDIFKFDKFIREYHKIDDEDISLAEIIRAYYPNKEEEIKELILAD